MDQERVFVTRKLSLKFGNPTVPPSLPLILSTKYDYDMKSKQVITLNDSHSDRLKLMPDAFQLLQDIEKPVAILSICGPYRTGKSYFLSRLLGLTESFKLGHTSHACTRGIWMATSVLECEEFVIVLLDTEGTDAVGGSESSCIPNLLVITVLLSSMLIYNSKNVPRARDFKKMRHFMTLSNRISVQEGDKISTNLTNHLPDFLWLLRDVDRLPGCGTNEQPSPTDFVLGLINHHRNDPCSSALKLFPSINCMILPPPSSNSAHLTKIFENSDQLLSQFNVEVDKIIAYILQRIQIKQGYKTAVLLNGNNLACLAEQYVTALNTPGDTLVLEAAWKTAVQLKLSRYARRLTCEYESEMKRSLNGKLPLEGGFDGEKGETLMNIHLQVFARKRLSLQKEILVYQPLSNSLEKKAFIESNILSDFDDLIVKYEADDCDQHRKERKMIITGGILLQFVRENNEKSRVQCMDVYSRSYQSLVSTKLQNALSTSMPTEINEELLRFHTEYFDKAVGPAKHRVYEQERNISKQLERDLKLIPGPVESLRVVGTGADRVKLKWDLPTFNQDAASTFEILVKSKKKNWESITTKTRCSILITGLESSKWYCFSVRAKNDKYKGNKVQFVRVRTLLNERIQKTLSTSSILAPQVVYPCMVGYVGTGYISKGIQARSVTDVIAGGLILTLVPTALIVGLVPVTGSLAANDIMQKEITDRKGNLEVDTDTAEASINFQDDSTLTSNSSIIDVPSDSEEDRYTESANQTQDLLDSSDDVC